MQRDQFALSRPLTSIFIGGGTPSLFSARSIATLMAGIGKMFDFNSDIEVTLESNPSSAEARRFAGYKAAGINRLSLGIQSFHDDSLKALGRVHNADQGRRAADLATQLFDRFNLDIMHGLPEQSAAMVEADLNEAISRGGSHLSWYQLTLEPNTVFWSRPPEIPVEPVLEEGQARGEALLRSAGYDQYEVSAWSRPSQASRHNLNYWQFGDYIGIGAGAHGKLSHPDGRIVRTQRTRQPNDYLSSVGLEQAVAATVVAAGEVPGEFMLNALRLRQGVPAALFSARTGYPLSVIEPTLSVLKEQGLVSKATERLSTTETGYRYLDDVVGRFFQ